jgi:hypothetical protein
LSNNKRSESFRTQSAETARSFCLFYRTGFEILGAGIRSRWISSGDVNNRRNCVLPISCCLWYSRSRAN